MMPVLFIGHGSPLNIILKNEFTKSLANLGKELPRPKAVLVISAHWLTEGTCVTCAKQPRTIYDFYGFPDELYRITYPSPGSPAVAKMVTENVKKVLVKCEYEWGLDHASWAVLRHVFPEANIPVVEMSLDYSPFNEWRPRSLKYYYDLSSELAPLREKDILIVGSGNIVHNLGLIDFDIDAKPFRWAIEFDRKVKDMLMTDNHEALINYKGLGEEASVSVPTLDHYLPMICAVGLQKRGESLKFIYEGFQHGSVSMRSFRIG